MLSIQPVNFKPNFGNYAQTYANDSYLEDQTRYQELQDEWQEHTDKFASLEEDMNLPKPVRKAAMVMKAISSGVLTGLGVVWASKKAGNITRSVLKSNSVSKAKTAVSDAFKSVKQPLKNVYAFIKKQANKIFEKYSDKKIIKTASEKISALKNSKISKIYNDCKKYVSDFVNNISEKSKAITPDEKFKKANDTVAGILGGGSGLAAAYEVARGGEQ